MSSVKWSRLPPRVTRIGYPDRCAGVLKAVQHIAIWSTFLMINVCSHETISETKIRPWESSWSDNGEAGVCLALRGEPAICAGYQGPRCCGSGGWERGPQGCPRAHRPSIPVGFPRIKGCLPTSRSLRPRVRLQVVRAQMASAPTDVTLFVYICYFSHMMYLVTLLSSDPQLSEERVTILCLLDTSFVHDF